MPIGDSKVSTLYPDTCTSRIMLTFEASLLLQRLVMRLREPLSKERTCEAVASIVDISTHG